MAAKEMYDYLPGTTSADYTATNLTLKARGTARESCVKQQIVHVADDGSETRVSFSNDPIFYLEIPYGTLNESDAGTLFDFWCDAAKANGIARSFQYVHGDGHTYVVRFDKSMERGVRLGNLFEMTIRLRVIDKV